MRTAPLLILLFFLLLFLLLLSYPSHCLNVVFLYRRGMRAAGFITGCWLLVLGRLPLCARVAILRIYGVLDAGLRGRAHFVRTRILVLFLGL